MKKHFILLTPHLVLFVTCFLALYFSIYMNNGFFSYTLDDAYIHLALSENIADGHYGINPGEYSSPASSIIYPYLLAPFSGTFLHHYIPLIINLLSAFGSVAAFLYIACLSGLTKDKKGQILSASLAVVLIFAYNIAGLIFTGMEHSTHILFSLLSVAGLIKFLKDGEIKSWFTIALITGPLVRYEGLGISVAALIIMFLSDRKLYAVLLGIVIFSIVGSFSFYLHSLGLSYLPSSVISKSSVLTDKSIGLDILNMLINPFYMMMSIPGGFLVLLAIGLLAKFRFADISIKSGEAKLIAFAVLAIGAHFVGGDIVPRYVIYIYSAGFGAAVYVWRKEILYVLDNIDTKGVMEKFMGVMLLVLIGGGPYMQVILFTPLASNNIYEQQYMMHRFATEYHKEPIAIMDLGWVSYHNPHYILDLWGLAQEETRKARTLKTSPMWMSELVEKHNLDLVIIYDRSDLDEEWQKVPPRWYTVGRLYMSRKRVTSGRNSVVFYSTNSKFVPKLIKKLEKFKKTLPEELKLHINHKLIQSDGYVKPLN